MKVLSAVFTLAAMAAVVLLSIRFVGSESARQTGSNRAEVQPSARSVAIEPDVSDAVPEVSAVPAPQAEMDRGEAQPVQEADKASVADSNPLGSDESDNGPYWVNEPEVMEALLFDYLAQLDEARISSIEFIECTRSDCEIEFTGTRKYTDSFLLNFRSVGAQQWSIRRTELSSGAPGFIAVLRSEEGRGASPGELELSETDLLEHASLAIPAEQDDLPRTLLGSYRGHELFLEHVCVGVCPDDTARVFYFDVPDGSSCDQLGGVEQTLLVNSGNNMAERKFCTPSILAEG